MSYANVLADRQRAVATCRATRTDLDGAVDAVVASWQSRPLPILAGVAATGFVLAQLQVGHAAVRAGMRIATGPAWRLVRQFLQA